MSTTFHAKQRRGFAAGSLKTYTCRCCKRVTRPTGTGDNDNVQLCEECFDLAGEENHLSDNGKFYGSAREVLSLIASVSARGGDASCWDTLKARAEAELAPKPLKLTIEIAPDDLRETLIALRDRRYTLTQELKKYAGHPVIIDLVQRQLARIASAGSSLATAVGEEF